MSPEWTIVPKLNSRLLDQVMRPSSHWQNESPNHLSQPPESTIS
jgi:hypothetical protein